MTTVADFERELEGLLTETVAQAKQREATAFPAFIGPYHKRIVLFGAGQMGRRVLSVLRRDGLEPMAFADNDPSKWGTTIDGIMVLDPTEAARRFGAEGAFIVTIWGAFSKDRMGARIAQLRALGCTTVETFESLSWHYAADLMPHYGLDSPHKVLAQADVVRQVLSLWSDDASRQEYLSQLRWRLYGDFEGLGDPVAHPIYFPPDVLTLQADEVFVDCGAFDGDTIKLFNRQTQGRFRKAIGFEPDPANFGRLVAALSATDGLTPPRVEVRCCATGARSEKLQFVADGSLGSHVSNAPGPGVIEVDCVALDDALPPDVATFIKMDIEGAELDALAGARRTIGAFSPVLAISAYHAQDHLWRVPSLIHELNADYDFYLRPHDNEMWDLVCYAVPRSRSARRQIRSSD